MLGFALWSKLAVYPEIILCLPVEWGATRVWWPGSSGHFQPLMSLAAKHEKLQATLLLPLETRKVACDYYCKSKTWSQKFF